MTEIPADLPPGPYREAVELANEATFTQMDHPGRHRLIRRRGHCRDLNVAAGRTD
ncbi:MAG TPA: hypothetical protein VFJ58_23200 [Armatimonadota bacterium]|nr:hypothetical protein [Armatimonadota bacterium]